MPEIISDSTYNLLAVLLSKLEGLEAYGTYLEDMDGERRKIIERQNLCNVLIGPHHDHAAGLSINAAHTENVVSALQVRTKHLLVVVQAVTAFAREQHRRHILNGELAMILLEHRAQVDRAVDVGADRRISPDR